MSRYDWDEQEEKWINAEFSWDNLFENHHIECRELGGGKYNSMLWIMVWGLEVAGLVVLIINCIKISYSATGE